GRRPVPGFRCPEHGRDERQSATPAATGERQGGRLFFSLPHCEVFHMSSPQNTTSWETTYPDLLTICAEAPNEAHRCYALRLLALECVRRLDSMSPGYRLRGARKNLVYDHVSYTAGLRLSDIIEGRP